MGEQSATTDQIAAKIAARQHGVLSYVQLATCGITKDGIYKRVRAGRLHRIHRGVYAVGHPGLSNEGRWMAAVLACGDGAALSHRSAAELWGLLRPRDNAWPHVTVPGTAGRKRRRGINLHRSPYLTKTATTRRKGISVTTPARTIADLKRTVPPHEVRRATRQAEIFNLPLDPDHRSDRTRSDLERLFLRICRRHRIPEPEVNVAVGPYTVDFLWPKRHLVVEADSWIYHRGRQARDDDLARDAHLRLRGYTVIRFTDRRLGDDPVGVAATVRALLA